MREILPTTSGEVDYYQAYDEHASLRAKREMLETRELLREKGITIGLGSAVLSLVDIAPVISK